MIGDYPQTVISFAQLKQSALFYRYVIPLSEHLVALDYLSSRERKFQGTFNIADLNIQREYEKYIVEQQEDYKALRRTLLPEAFKDDARFLSMVDQINKSGRYCLHAALKVPDAKEEIDGFRCKKEA